MSVEPPVVRPGTLAEALELMAAGGYRPLAGGTDLMVQLEADVVEPPAAVLDLWRLDELRGVGYDGYDVSIGALTTWTELRHSPVIRARLPALSEAAATIGAAQIQNRGTIGGNICNASPAGDSLPVLLAVDATFDVGSAAGERVDPGTRVLDRLPADGAAAGRAAAARALPRGARPPHALPQGRRAGRARPSPRSSWPSATGMTAPTWTEVRLALGSVAPTPIRARRTEAVLEGAAPREAVADEAAAVLAEEISPIDDVRSTAAYRRSVSGRVLHRLLREEGGW